MCRSSLVQSELFFAIPYKAWLINYLSIDLTAHFCLISLLSDFKTALFFPFRWPAAPRHRSNWGSSCVLPRFVTMALADPFLPFADLGGALKYSFFSSFRRRIRACFWSSAAPGADRSLLCGLIACKSRIEIRKARPTSRYTSLP